MQSMFLYSIAVQIVCICYKKMQSQLVRIVYFLLDYRQNKIFLKIYDVTCNSTYNNWV